MGIILKWRWWLCVKNVIYSVCKNFIDIDFWGKKEKGVFKNNMEENGNGRDEEFWYWLGKSYKIRLEIFKNFSYVFFSICVKNSLKIRFKKLMLVVN